MPINRFSIGLRTAAAAVVLVAASGCTLERSEGERDGDKATPSTKAMTFELAGDFRKLSLDVPTKPVGTVGTNVDGIDLEVYAVQRSNKVATVVFALHNTGSETTDMGPVGQNLDENKAFDGTFVASDVAIVDTQGLKEYRSFVVEDDGNSCLCSVAYNQNQDDLQPEERRYYATQVPAPPAGVTEVNVRTGLGAVSGVEIES